MEWVYEGPLPYAFTDGGAVILNNEIHILGSANKHYKYQNNQWTSVSTLPYSFSNGSAVVLNDEIHILGGSTNGTKHYKYSNGEWISVSTLPYVFYYGSAVVLNGEIHILGSIDSNSYTKHYKYSNGEWTSVSTLPYNFYSGSAVVLDGEIHILGASTTTNYTKHYKYSGGQWTQVSTLPYKANRPKTLIIDGEIYIFGTSADANINGRKVYKYHENQWVLTSITLPYQLSNGASVLLNNEINILGGSYTDVSNAHNTKHFRFTNDKYSNKVIFGNSDILDITMDNVTVDKLLTDATSHDSGGRYIRGNIAIKEITPTDDYVYAQTLYTNGIYKPTASAYMIKKYYSKTPTADGVAFDAGFNKMSAGGVAYTQRPCGRNLFSYAGTASRSTSWGTMTMISSVYDADGGAYGTMLDPHFGHFDGNNGIVVDRAIPVAYIHGAAFRGVTSSGTAVYSGVRLLKNGTVIHSLYGSSSDTSPTCRRIQTSFAVGDVITIQTRTSSTTQAYCRIEMGITWAGS